MGAAAEIILAFLVCIGLLGLGWLLFGRLLTPAGGVEAWAVVPGEGDGEELEQTVSGLLWLRGSGLWRGCVVIADCGLTPAGRAAAQALLQRGPTMGVCLHQEIGGYIDLRTAEDNEEE